MSALKDMDDYWDEHGFVLNTQEVADLDDLDERAQNAFEEKEEVIPVTEIAIVVCLQK